MNWTQKEIFIDIIQQRINELINKLKINPNMDYIEEKTIKQLIEKYEEIIK